MKKLKYLGILFISIFVFCIPFMFNKSYANSAISDNGTVIIDAETNSDYSKLRFIVTSKGVSFDEVDTVEVILYKDGVKNVNPIYLTTLFTSISNASREYNAADNTYYALLTIEEAQGIAFANIEYVAKITYKDESYKLSDSKSFVVPNGLFEITEGYYEFGSYPQSDASESEAETLNNLVGTYDNLNEGYEFISYGYYYNGSEKDWWKYIDIDLDSDGFNDFRGVYIEGQERGYQLDYYEAGVIHWFKYEPIKWSLIDSNGTDALLFSNGVLDSQEINNRVNNGTYANYIDSYMNNWLNNTFYNTAFNKFERPYIKSSTINNNTESTDSNIKTDDLTTKIFLLSSYEVNSYYPTQSERIVSTGTNYADSQGLYDYNSAWWWTRTPSTENSKVVHIAGNGVFNNTEGNYHYIGVRPAMWIDASKIALDTNFTLNNQNAGSVSETTITSLPTQTITNTATPNDTYSFIGWYLNDTCVSTDKTHSFYVSDSSLTYEARFAQYKLNVQNLNPEYGDATTYTNKCVSEGTEVNLVATPADGYVFEGWYNGSTLLSTEENYTYTMGYSDITITAIFTYYSLSTESYLLGCEDDYTVTFDAQGGSSVSSQKATCLSYPVIPTKNGYVFGGWYTEQACTNVFDFSSSITEDITLYAKWIEYTGDDKVLSVNSKTDILIQDIDSHTSDATYYAFIPLVTGDVEFYTVGDHTTNIYLYNSNKTLLAKTENSTGNFTFTRSCDAGTIYYISLTKNETDSNPDRLYINQDLNVTNESYGTITSYSNKAISVGDVVTLIASPNKKYSFVGWYINDELVSSDLTYEYTMTAANVTIVAKFTQYTLTVSSENTEYGTCTIYNNKAVTAGSSVLLTATANEGYEFSGWYIDTTCISTEASYSYTMPNSDVAIVAKFN
ncbi:MAG: InlB B-repeat-containing protein [Acholeplasmatales bacterium]|nr:InlB B-repeat-containing protein [Acholeplasmatales bacterium]